MQLFTSIYYTEVMDSHQGERKNGQLDPYDLKDTKRQWLSIYKEKNRVEPIDGIGRNGS